jgi:two-component system, NtrC family, sensor histidine kinase GlrK
MIGYLVIFLVMMAVSVFALLKLRQFNRITHHILNIDYRIMENEKKLADSMLSQLRYEKKYNITKDIALYNQFLAAKDRFDQYLNEIASIADLPQKKESVEKIRAYHDRYQKLVGKEVELIRKNQAYPKKDYEKEKEMASDGVLTEVEVLGSYSKEDIYGNMKMLGEAGSSSRMVGIGISAVAVILIIITSFFITRSITHPLRLLMDKTREVSEGVFKSDLVISSPPEMSRLSVAFNLMCDKLRAVDKMKSDFFSMMSHELRTPLTSIREGTSLLQEGVGGTITEKQKRLLTIIAEESHRLIALVDSLLDLSKMEAGMMTYSFDKTSLSSLIDKATNEIVPLVEAKKIGLRSEVDSGLPLIKADGERILQALRNLVGNAVKFTPEGGCVQVSAKAIGPEVQVSISDTGPGIPAEHLTTIFDKFQQATPTGSYKIKGTGLGLAIVKHIVLSHGGKIWAESKPGKGSTFIFVLPA